MRFSRSGLAQATRDSVARERAQRIKDWNSKAVCLDGTGGLGGDAMALSEAGLLVLALELHPLTCRLLRHNVGLAGGRAQVLRADCTRAPLDWTRVDVLILDPDRRASGARTLDARRWSPDWRQCCDLLARARAACVKLPPGSDPEQLERSLPRGLAHAWQWISDERELVELALWTGALASTVEGGRQALALRRGVGDLTVHGPPSAVGSTLAVDDWATVRWLADPDPALVRSRLVGHVAESAELVPLDDLGSIWAGRREPLDPWFRAYRVLDSSAADPRRVRSMLAQHDLGAVELVMRGHPGNGAELARRFRGRAPGRGRLVLTRLGSGHRAWLVEPERHA